MRDRPARGRSASRTTWPSEAGRVGGGAPDIRRVSETRGGSQARRGRGRTIRGRHARPNLTRAGPVAGCSLGARDGQHPVVGAGASSVAMAGRSRSARAGMCGCRAGVSGSRLTTGLPLVASLIAQAVVA